MAWLVPGMAMMVVRVRALLALVTALPAFVMVSLAPALATMAARVTALPAFVMVSMAPALALLLLLLLLPLPALVLAGTRARRLEQLKTRRRHEASGLVRGRRQLPRLQGAAAAVEA